MNLILQAIKSLFRGVESRIPKNLNDILRIIGKEKIPGKYVEVPDHNHGITPVESGGTGATTVTDALYNLGFRPLTVYTRQIKGVGSGYIAAKSELYNLVEGGIYFVRCPDRPGVAYQNIYFGTVPNVTTFVDPAYCTKVSTSEKVIFSDTHYTMLRYENGAFVNIAT